MARYLSRIKAKGAEKSSRWLARSAHRYRRSVIFSSPEKRLPGALTTTNRRSGSERTMAATFLNWPASLREDPPNFTVLIMKWTSFPPIIYTL